MIYFKDLVELASNLFALPMDVIFFVDKDGHILLDSM